LYPLPYLFNLQVREAVLLAIPEPLELALVLLVLLLELKGLSYLATYEALV
jgi:hypothetical protein